MSIVNFLDDKGYQVLKAAAGTRILLPSLRTLDWRPVDDEIFPFVHLFLGPKLTNIDLLLYGSPLVRLPLMTILNTKYPFLIHLRLKLQQRKYISREQGRAVIDAVSTAICGWHDLECLYMAAFSSEGLRNLGALPKLRRLELIDAEYSLQNIPLDTPAFTSLTSLDLQCNSLIFCTDVITAMKNGILQTMHVEISGLSSPSMWAQLMTALNNPCSHASLVDIFMGTSGNDQENDDSKLAIQTAHNG